MWEIEYLTGAGRLEPTLAVRLDELLTTDDPSHASDLAMLIESSVAPISGGVSDEAGSVASILVAGLPRMTAEARPEALLLLTQIVGSIQAQTGTESTTDAGQVIEAALPLLAAIVEVGSEAEIAQGIDLISLCASFSRPGAERAAFYLARIAASASGAVRDSAEKELDEISKLIERAT